MLSLFHCQQIYDRKKKRTCFRKQLLLISIKINTFSKRGSELEPGKEKMLNQSLAAEPIFHKYKQLVQSKLKKITAKKYVRIFLSILIQYVSATFQENNTTRFNECSQLCQPCSKLFTLATCSHLLWRTHPEFWMMMSPPLTQAPWSLFL